MYCLVPTPSEHPLDSSVSPAKKRRQRTTKAPNNPEPVQITPEEGPTRLPQARRPAHQCNTAIHHNLEQLYVTCMWYIFVTDCQPLDCLRLLRRLLKTVTSQRKRHPPRHLILMSQLQVTLNLFLRVRHSKDKLLKFPSLDSWRPVSSRLLSINQLTLMDKIFEYYSTWASTEPKSQTS